MTVVRCGVCFLPMRLLATPLSSYWTFLRSPGNTRFIAFGFVLTLASNFGQTFFIALSGGHIREAFSLTDGQFGLIYSLATLASGFSIIWLGTLIDRLDVRSMTLMVCCGMIIAALLMAASPAILVLGLALFLLRLNGQGLLGHISTTCMARYFNSGRGKAISLASLGYPAGEAILPILFVAIIALIGWRMSWLIVAGALVVTLIPMVLWLLIGHGDRHRAHVAALHDAEAKAASQNEFGAAVGKARGHQWTRPEVLRDSRFYMILPAALSPAFIVTGLFFHQVHMVEEQGWRLDWFAACFAAYAAAQLASALGSGEVIDRIGARQILPLYLLPLIGGLLLLATLNHAVLTPLLLMAMLGLTAGMVGPLVNSTWAELYGVKHLGSIRALSTACMVFSTSLSPFLMGTLIDAQVSIGTIATGFLVIATAASVSAFIALRHADGDDGRCGPAAPERIPAVRLLDDVEDPPERASG
ncbi:MAG TPA: MFS transporter [Phycisphaerales bacterium]|nr:MFS transporter [Phycisphaerales bacterium]HRQ75145.1 MFS transporter [Phycisphaerales bacterium]